MASKWKLSKETIKLIEQAEEAAQVITAAREALEDEVQDHNDAFEDMSEKWQEGERGEAVREWIDNVETAAGYLDDIDIDVPVEVEF